MEYEYKPPEQDKEAEVKKYVDILTLSYAASEGAGDVQHAFLKWQATQEGQSLSAEFINANKDKLVEGFINRNGENLTGGKSHTGIDVETIKADLPTYIDSLASSLHEGDALKGEQLVYALDSLLQKESAYQYKGREREVNGVAVKNYDSQLRNVYLTSDNQRSPIAKFYDYMVGEVRSNKLSATEKETLQRSYTNLKREYSTKHPGEEFDPKGKLAFLEE